MFFTREKELYARIIKAVSNDNPTCGSIGKTFCKVPDSVVKELAQNGYVVHLIESKGFKHHIHNILVLRS